MQPFEKTVITEKTFDQAVAAIEKKAAENGFSVLHTHDAAATLSERISAITPEDPSRSAMRSTRASFSGNRQRSPCLQTQVGWRAAPSLLQRQRKRSPPRERGGEPFRLPH